MSFDLKNWCQKRYRARYQHLRVLPVPDSAHALWLDDGRVRAVVGSSLPEGGFYGLHLALTNVGGSPQWFLRGPHGWEKQPERDALDLLDAADVEPDAALRQLVVQSIHHDHAQELDGNLLAGFVQRLDQQFSRAELYLFELLQNAVDERAQRVSFELRGDTLVFQHDGEPFNASDVLGLSAVGASGKSGRTIGFMGLGFKAVYSRFDRVVLSGGGWCVKYERPGDSREGGWKFLPEWYAEATAPDAGFTCRFDFARAIGGGKAVVEDLSKLDDVVPVLLARRALKSEQATWHLDWNGRAISVERELDGPAGVERLRLSDGTHERRWFFLGTTWSPAEKATDAWRAFRLDPDGNPGEQELTLFAELDDDGNLVSQGEGFLHAVLPTAEALPLGFNLQANWLLRADRQGAMSARSNAWNADIVAHLPDLVIRLLRWIAAGDGPPEIDEPYSRLPILDASDGAPCLTILDLQVDFSAVVDALRTDALTPYLDVAASSTPLDNAADEARLSAGHDRELARAAFVRPPECEYQFTTAEQCRVIPDSLLDELSPRFLRTWLGGLAPFAFESNQSAGAFFRSTGVIAEVAEAEWTASAVHYESALRALPSDRVRAWASIHVAAAALRAKHRRETMPEGLAIIPNGEWRPRGVDDLFPPPRQYLFLEESVRQLLAPNAALTPAVPLLQLIVAPPTGHDVDDGSARVVSEAMWKKGTDNRQLREVTEPFFIGEAADRAGWEANREEHIRRVVAVTAAIRRLRGSEDAVTHILAMQNGTLSLKPKASVWVGAKYGFPHVETAAGGKVALVSDRYGDDVEWPAFFTSACQSFPRLQWSVSNQIDAQSYAELLAYVHAAPTVASRASRSVSLDLPFDLGSGHRDWVQILETSLDPWADILESDAFDVLRARAFASVLAQGRYAPSNFSGVSLSPLHTYATWVKTAKIRAFEQSKKMLPRWVTALRDRPWVPTDGGAVVRPCDVYLEPDPRNPSAPIADLDPATKIGLALLADVLQFGSAVPRPGPLAELLRAAERSDTSNETMRILWVEVLADADLDLELLRTRARVLDIVPTMTSRRDGRHRVSSGRLVKTGNADFGGFLCALVDTTVAEHAERLAELLEVPDRPTARQAVAYLEWVWANEPPEVDDAVGTAWRAVVADRREWPTILGDREAGKMKLFCRLPGARRGEWLQLPGAAPREPVWNDAPDKAACLRPTDGLWPEAWIYRQAPGIDVEAFVELSGVARLSDDRFLLAWNTSGNDAMPDETARLRRIVTAIRAIHDDELLPAGELVLRCAQSIERTFRVGTGTVRVEQQDASWDGDRILHVVGRRAALWASDLRPLVQEALELRTNSRGLRLLDLIPLLDDGPNFERKLEQMCAELDVPSDAFEVEPARRGNEEGSAGAAFAGASVDEADDDEDWEHDSPSDDSDLDDADDDDADGRARSDGTGTGARQGEAEPNGDGAGQRSGGAPKRRASGGASQNLGIAPNRFLIHHVDGNADAAAASKGHVPKDDIAARAAVMVYERRYGRIPTEADRNQRGYDVSSMDGDVERKIEVKGLQGAWQGQATVSMTGAQFDDARTKEGNWWLYVVENAGSEGANVIAIPNPAVGAREFYLYAFHWRGKAVTPPPKRLQAPDDDES